MKLTVGLLVLATAFSAASAQAASLLDDFQAICLKSDADPKTALSLADAAGWMHVPDALMGQLTGAVKGMTNADGRLRSDSAGLHFMIVAQTGPNLPPDALIRGIDHASVCAVGTAPAEPSFASQFASWAAVPEEPYLSKGATHGYAFTVAGDLHKRVDPKGSEMTELVKAGSVRLAFVESDAQITLAGFAAPLKEPH